MALGMTMTSIIAATLKARSMKGIGDRLDVFKTENFCTPRQPRE